MQSTWENLVDFNLSESGVHPLTPRELLASDDLDAVLDQPLAYTQSNGTVALRSLDRGAVSRRRPPITSRSPTAAPKPTTSPSWRLDRARRRGRSCSSPTTCRRGGWCARSAARSSEWPLIEDRDAGRWRPDLDAAVDASSRTGRALIIICTPNNPTGARLTSDELDAIARDRRSPWLPGCSRTRSIAAPSSTATRRRRCGDASERVIVTSGLSKAYGLPGLRIGWIAAPPSFVASTWSYHDYTTIAPGALERSAGARGARTRAPTAAARAHPRHPAREPAAHRRRGCATHAPMFSWIPPEAGAIVYVRYNYRDQLDGAGHAAARRKERAGRPRRSLRHGRLPAARIRRAARTTCARDSIGFIELLARCARPGRPLHDARQRQMP